MKFLPLLLLTLLISGCEVGTMDYGYHYNPKNIFAIGLESIANNDGQNWSELFNRKALCMYGNQDGMFFVKKALHPYGENISISTPLLTKKSGYNEQYKVFIIEESSGKKLFSAEVQCKVGPEIYICNINQLKNLIGADINHPECNDL